jgi:hypothetical protein
VEPVAKTGQAAFKTRFSGGQMAGYYLNLYATVTPELLKALNIRSASGLVAVVRNGEKSYDFPLKCEGGLSAGCGSLAFNGKSDLPWNDTLLWEAYDNGGKILASAKVPSMVFEAPSDTGTAILWAAARLHYSEKKELPPGPAYGFVDEWASLLSLPGDSIPPALVAYYQAKGVPRIANSSVKDVIPNYAEGKVANPGNIGTPDPWNPRPGPTTALAARLGSLSDPVSWRVERSQGGFLVRIGGLAGGLRASVELYDLAGKRAGYWAPRSEEGALNLASADVRPGVYFLKVRVAGRLAVKRIVL